MFKTPRDKMTTSGTIVLTIGLVLLILTFISAYGFLTQSLSILTSNDLAQTFGQALAPLISACIHVMYLGVMGWIGSLVTIRGLTMISQARQMLTIPARVPMALKQAPQPMPKVNAQKPQSESGQPKKEPEVKPEPKPYEPEIVVMTPEMMSQTQEKPQEPKQEPEQEPQQNQT